MILVLDYSFNELKNYIVEDFNEFLEQWNYTVEQACYRIIDDYHNAISRSVSQRDVIYVCMGVIVQDHDVIPGFIRDEINLISKDFSQKEYLDMDSNDYELFTNELLKVKL